MQDQQQAERPNAPETLECVGCSYDEQGPMFVYTKCPRHGTAAYEAERAARASR